MPDPQSETERPRWPTAVAAFLLGLFSIIWWQRRQDETLLRQMDANGSPSEPLP